MYKPNKFFIWLSGWSAWSLGWSSEWSSGWSLHHDDNQDDQNSHQDGYHYYQNGQDPNPDIQGGHKNNVDMDPPG